MSKTFKDYLKETMDEDVTELAPNDGGSESVNSQLKSWYEKYNQYKSADARMLADGMFDFYLSSGVDLDTVEKGEYEAVVKKHGEDKVSGNALQYIDEMPTLVLCLMTLKR